MRMFPQIQYWVTSFFLFILTANLKVSNSTQNSLSMRFLYFWQSVTVNYSRRPLFRMLFISNIRYSEQNFRSLEFTLKNSYNLCCLFRTPLFRTFRYFERFFRPPGPLQVPNKCSEFYLFWLPLYYTGMISPFICYSTLNPWIRTISNSSSIEK